MLLTIGIAAAGWVALCVLFIAMAVSAKRGDDEEAARIPEPRLPLGGRRVGRRASALS